MEFYGQLRFLDISSAQAAPVVKPYDERVSEGRVRHMMKEMRLTTNTVTQKDYNYRFDCVYSFRGPNARGCYPVVYEISTKEKKHHSLGRPTFPLPFNNKVLGLVSSLKPNLWS